jgi:serine/threonine protein phosphatase PrpC
MVDDEAIAARMAYDAGDMSRLVRDLVGLANEAGGQDNITVVAIAVKKA